LNVNLAVAGVLLACVISALGFAEHDPVGQWYVPGGIVLVAFVLAYLRAPKERSSKEPQQQT
jgi:hypothetical protein